MEAKENRPYVALLVEINKIQFAIPLRTNIRHSYCYKFKTWNRETDSITGIDYSKAVVISNDSYLGEVTDINDKEYLELQQKTFFIINKLKNTLMIISIIKSMVEMNTLLKDTRSYLEVFRWHIIKSKRLV